MKGWFAIGGQSLEAVLPPLHCWWYKEFLNPLHHSQSAGKGQEMSSIINSESSQALSAIFVLLTVPVAVSEDLFELEVLRDNANFQQKNCKQSAFRQDLFVMYICYVCAYDYDVPL